MNLLTPKQVAERLNISVRTVYENKDKLGGFYPCGIKVLQFRKGYLNGYLGRQTTEGLGLQFQISTESVCREGVQDQERSQGSERRKTNQDMGFKEAVKSVEGDFNLEKFN